MWKRIWEPHPQEKAAERELNRSLVEHWISGALFLRRLLGNYSCGIVALEAYFSDKPEVTADYVSHRLDGYYSVDTARRRLTEMVKAGVVTSRKSGRTVLFKLDPKVAEATISYMRGEPIILPPSH
jgi:hypothetical protein